MAKTIAPALQDWNGDGRLFLWENIVEGDTCLPVNINERQAEVAVDVFGTFGGSTIAVVGSLNQVKYSAVDDAYGSAMSYTAASGVKPVGPKVNAVNATITGGTSADIDVLLYVLNER